MACSFIGRALRQDPEQDWVRSTRKEPGQSPVLLAAARPEAARPVCVPTSCTAVSRCPRHSASKNIPLQLSVSLPFLDSFPNLCGDPGFSPLLSSLLLFWAAAAVSPIVRVRPKFLRLIFSVTVSTISGQPERQGYIHWPPRHTYSLTKAPKLRTDSYSPSSLSGNPSSFPSLQSENHPAIYDTPPPCRRRG